MDPITIVALAIVLSGVVLIAAAGLTSGAEEAPQAGAGAAAVPVKLWCPVVREQTRVGIGADRAGENLTLVWCDRFPAGPVPCNRACLPTRAAA
jgi:hypothetical protein